MFNRLTFEDVEKMYDEKETFTRDELIKIIKIYNYRLKNAIEDNLEFLFGESTLLSGWCRKAIHETKINTPSGAGNNEYKIAQYWNIEILKTK